MKDVGGPDWSQIYVQPFYMKVPSASADDEAVAALLPRLRTLAMDLSRGDIVSMLKMQWRIQSVGTWFAIARCDPSFSDPIHDGFDACYGHLTSPSLVAAALIYPSERTAEVLTAYRERAMAGGYETAGSVVDVALHRISGGVPGELNPRAQERLDALLARAHQLQSLPD